MTLVVAGSAGAFAEAKPRHSSGKKVFELADVLIDTCVPAGDAVVPVAGHLDKVGPVSTMAFVAVAWMTVTTVAEILAGRGVKLFINPYAAIPSMHVAFSAMIGVTGALISKRAITRAFWCAYPVLVFWVVVVTAKDLTLAERMRLNGGVERVLQKGAYTREALLAEVRELVRAYAPRGT